MHILRTLLILVNFGHLWSIIALLVNFSQFSGSFSFAQVIQDKRREFLDHRSPNPPPPLKNDSKRIVIFCAFPWEERIHWIWGFSQFAVTFHQILVNFGQLWSI